MNMINVIFRVYYFFRRFKDDVFPGESLLSRARLSVFAFDHGFSGIILVCVYFFSIL